MGPNKIRKKGLKNVANNRLTIRCRYLNWPTDSILTDQIGVQTTMKSFRRFSLGYIVALAASVLLSASAQAETKHNRAVVRAIHGSGAQVSSNKGQSWVTAKVGQFLGANSVVKTASDTTVDLFLGDNGPVV